MREFEKRRRTSGFTLVELLIVIMIIAILAGMMLLATGAALDNAKATRVINDMRDLKSAALLYYADNSRWPATGEEASLDHYYDRPLVAGNTYASVTIGDWYDDNRVNIGIELTNDNGTDSIQRKLAAKAVDAGLLANDTSDTVYTTGKNVWMNLR